MNEPLKDECHQIAGGRCSSCRFLQSHELPLRTVFFCRALMREMDAARKDEIRRCPSWEAFRAFTRRRREDASEGLSRELFSLERRLFGASRQSLARQGADLKTVMLLAQPSIEKVADLDWIDDLDPQLPERSLSELLPRLRELSYDALADQLTPFVVRETRMAA